MPLRPYRAFYRLLRAELGLTVVDDPMRRRALEERRDYLQGRLRALAPQHFERLITIVQAKLLGVTVDTDDADPESYTELFDEVLRVPSRACDDDCRLSDS